MVATFFYLKQSFDQKTINEPIWYQGMQKWINKQQINEK